MNETVNIILRRKSIRSFTDREISADDRDLILQSAISAPSPGNQQLYTIIDVQDREKMEALAVSCDYQPFIASAKMILVFCADCLKWYQAFKDAGCDPRMPGSGDLLLAVSDANIAAQTAVLAAESLGIGSCYIGDIMENCERQQEILNLPEYVFPAAMVVFGYPTPQQMNREKPPRPDIDQIVYKDSYPALNHEELKQTLLHKAGTQPYEEWIKAFCNRKYNSDFSVEMTRSVNEFLKQYNKQE